MINNFFNVLPPKYNLSDNIVCDSMNLDILEGGFSKAVMFGIKKAELILKEKDTDADKN